MSYISSCKIKGIVVIESKWCQRQSDPISVIFATNDLFSDILSFSNSRIHECIRTDTSHHLCAFAELKCEDDPQKVCDKFYKYINTTYNITPNDIYLDLSLIDASEALFVFSHKHHLQFRDIAKSGSILNHNSDYKPLVVNKKSDLLLLASSIGIIRV